MPRCCPVALNILVNVRGVLLMARRGCSEWMMRQEEFCEDVFLEMAQALKVRSDASVRVDEASTTAFLANATASRLDRFEDREYGLKSRTQSKLALSQNCSPGLSSINE